jgi:hypothetical protein
MSQDAYSFIFYDKLDENYSLWEICNQSEKMEIIFIKKANLEFFHFENLKA